MESPYSPNSNNSENPDSADVEDIRSQITLAPELLLESRSSKDSNNKRYVDDSKKESDKFIEKFLVGLSIILTVILFPISLFCIFVVVRQFERAVILRNGKIYKDHSFGPGLIFYLPCVDTVKFIDLRSVCYAVPPQEVTLENYAGRNLHSLASTNCTVVERLEQCYLAILTTFYRGIQNYLKALTKDSLTVSVDAVVFYKIINPVWAVINVANYRKSTQYLAETTLRNAVGMKKLSELLTNRPAVSQNVFRAMKHYTKEWGIQVVRVEIKDICLPLQLQKAMAAEAESARLTNAKIKVAQAEIESTKSLQAATAMLMDNPLCMQLRYLQSLHMIAGPNTHTIVFPFSANIFQKMFK